MSDESDDRPPVERLIEAALFGPFDLTARVVQEIPSAVHKTKQQLVFARFLGKMAVGQGVAELRRRVDGSPEAADADPADADDVEAIVPDADEADTSGATPPVLRDGDLALPDYEHLPAAHVVAKLAGLSQPERDAIESYERAHRNRRTVLGKLDQLRET